MSSEIGLLSSRNIKKSPEETDSYRVNDLPFFSCLSCYFPHPSQFLFFRLQNLITDMLVRDTGKGPAAYPFFPLPFLHITVFPFFLKQAMSLFQYPCALGVLKLGVSIIKILVRIIFGPFRRLKVFFRLFGLCCVFLFF